MGTKYKKKRTLGTCHTRKRKSKYNNVGKGQGSSCMPISKKEIARQSLARQQQELIFENLKQKRDRDASIAKSNADIKEAKFQRGLRIAQDRLDKERAAVAAAAALATEEKKVLAIADKSYTEFINKLSEIPNNNVMSDSKRIKKPISSRNRK